MKESVSDTLKKQLFVLVFPLRGRYYWLRFASACRLLLADDGFVSDNRILGGLVGLLLILILIIMIISMTVTPLGTTCVVTAADLLDLLSLLCSLCLFLS